MFSQPIERSTYVFGEASIPPQSDVNLIARQGTIGNPGRMAYLYRRNLAQQPSAASAAEEQDVRGWEPETQRTLGGP